MAEWSFAENDYHRRLTKYMLVTMMVVSVLPLLLISGIIRHFCLSPYTEKVHSHLKTVVSRHQKILAGFLDDRLRAVRTQAKTLSLGGRDCERTLRRVLPILQEAYGNSFTELGLLNGQGAPVGYAGPSPPARKDFSKTPWFQTALADGYCISDVFEDSGGSRRFAVAASEEWDGERWVLYAGISADQLDSLLAKIGEGPSGSAFIFNRRGEMQCRGPGNAFGKETLCTEAAFGGASEEVRVAERIDTSGAPVLVLSTDLNHGMWVLCATRNAKEVYSAIYRARNLSIVTLVVGVVGILGMSAALSRRMITHIAHTEQEKRAINEQLVEAGRLASLGEMAAGIAHEINHPVGIMVQEAGWMQDLVEDYEHDPTTNIKMEEFTRSLTKIRTQGMRCREITRQLLSFARRTDQATKSAQVNDLIEEAAALTARRARHSNVQIVRDLMQGLPEILISPSEILQVLLNIINNAIDVFDSNGGTIRISTSMHGQRLVIEISDDGPGIAKEHIPRIFEPFFTTKPVGKGTGLGLSICYGIVKKLGGDLTVTSDQGKGTAFRIVMPVKTS